MWVDTSESILTLISTKIRVIYFEIDYKCVVLLYKETEQWAESLQIEILSLITFVNIVRISNWDISAHNWDFLLSNSS